MDFERQAWGERDQFIAMDFNYNFTGSDRIYTIGKIRGTLNQTPSNLLTNFPELTGIQDVTYYDNQGSNVNEGFIARLNIEGINDIIINTESELLTNSKLKIIPNPNDGKFVIQLEEINLQIGHLTIYDVIGNLAYEQKGIKSNHLEIDLSSMSKGIYFLKMIINEKLILKK